MGDFLSSIFGGHNSGLDKPISNLGDLAGYSQNLGEKGSNAAYNYNSGILSGDPSQVAMTLAPETKTLQDQAQQNKNTVAQFGNRGGGMNAVMAGLDDATRAKFISLLGNLRQGASDRLQQQGTTNLGMATNDNATQAQLAQQQYQNMLNGILGKGLSTLSGLGTSALGNHLFPGASTDGQ